MTRVQGGPAGWETASAGDPVDAFVAVHGDRLLRLAYLLTGSRHDAEDLWQDTLVDVLRRWAAVEQSGAPTAYVRKIMVNRHISTRRRAVWRLERTTAPDLLPEATHGQPDATASVDTGDDLWGRLATLTPRLRTVLVLRYYEDLSDEQIAGLLGIARGSVTSAASRGVAALRSQMGDDHE